MIVSLSGIAGSGKSNIGKKAADILGWQFVPQPDNPFLIPFYRDPERWAFPSQLFFIIEFFKSISLDNDAIYEHNIHESMLFARAQLEVGYIQLPEYKLLTSIYHELSPIWPNTIFLIDTPCTITSSRLLSRQQLNELSLDYGKGMIYLKKLHDLYASWKPNCRLIKMSHSDIDRRTVENPEKKLSDIIRELKSHE